MSVHDSPGVSSVLTHNALDVCKTSIDEVGVLGVEGNSVRGGGLQTWSRNGAEGDKCSVISQKGISVM